MPAAVWSHTDGIVEAAARHSIDTDGHDAAASR
jgi:hypothetical protein